MSPDTTISMGNPSSVAQELYSPPMPRHVGRPESAEIPAPVMNSRLSLSESKSATDQVMFGPRKSRGSGSHCIVNRHPQRALGASIMRRRDRPESLEVKRPSGVKHPAAPENALLKIPRRAIRDRLFKFPIGRL